MTNLTCTQIGNDLVVGTLKHQPDAVVVIADEAQRFVPERTCKPEWHDTEVGAGYYCSECLTPIAATAQHYCYGCGAKVIEA